jgi:hypothetical protein
MSEAGGDTEYDISVHNIINYNPDLTECTGYTYDGTNNWTSNNQCYNNISLAQADIADIEDVTSGYKTWDVANMARAWRNDPNINYGLLVNFDTSASADSYRTFASSEAAEENHKPKLIVTYTIDPEIVPPRDVSNAHKENQLGNKLTLAWKNPDSQDGNGQLIPENQDFAGVMIRYNIGETPPASHTEGTLFGQKTGNTDENDSFTNEIDQISDCQFSFFTYDEDENYSSTVHLSLDTTLPGQMNDFTAVTGDGQVELSWINPDENFVGVMIRCSTVAAPDNYLDGSLIYNGTGSNVTHTQNVINGTPYYYSAFTYNTANTYNIALATSATPQENPGTNQAPIVTITSSYTGEANSGVNFTSSVEDPDGQIIACHWDFGDGDGNDNCSATAHTYSKPGSYTVTATSTDDDGATGADSINVLISPDVTSPKIVSAVAVQ